MREGSEASSGARRRSGRADARILITGMSGTGKSSVIGRLRAGGYAAYDVDDEGWTRRAPDGGWVWREERVERLLAEHREGLLFLSGCAESQVRFYPELDHVILLSAPPVVLEERLRRRIGNPYGKRPGELEEVLRYARTVEPLLRRSADHEIDATLPLETVVQRVLELACTGGP